MLKINSLIWNSWNTLHLQKHEVTPVEVEEVCRGIYQHQPTYGERVLIIGKTQNNRLLTIILAREENNRYFVVTAHDSSKKERKNLYDQNENSKI